MPGLIGYDCEGTLTIDGYSMNRPAWAVLGDENGNGGLWQLKFHIEKRGEDRLVPAAAGVIAYPRRLAPPRLDLNINITGDVDASGVATADSRSGLEANLAALYANVVVPPTLPDVTRTATLTMFGGGTISAEIHVLGIAPRGFLGARPRQSFIEATLQISIPAGRFA